MAYYPVFLDIEGKRCVVVGGGAVGLRKVRMLLDFGANVTVISPHLCSELRELADEDRVDTVKREYETGDLEEVFLVVAATDDMAINTRVAEEATRKGKLINVVDVPRLSNFIVPSYLRRGDLTVAVSTNGKSPALARKIRTEMERHIGDEYAMLTSLIDEVRCQLKGRDIAPSTGRWQQALDLEALLGLLRSGQHAEAKERLLSLLEEG